jgi:hypothetical protein
MVLKWPLSTGRCQHISQLTAGHLGVSSAWVSIQYHASEGSALVPACDGLLIILIETTGTDALGSPLRFYGPEVLWKAEVLRLELMHLAAL